MTQTNKSAIARSLDFSQIFTDDVAYVMALEAKLEADANANSLIEVDSPDGSIYRVWKGMKVIGLVKRCLASNNWVAEPAKANNKRGYPSSELAIAAVVKAWEVA